MIFSKNGQHIPRCPGHIFRSQLAEEHLNLLTNHMGISLKVINLFVVNVMLTVEIAVEVRPGTIYSVWILVVHLAS